MSNKGSMRIRNQMNEQNIEKEKSTNSFIKREEKLPVGPVLSP